MAQPNYVTIDVRATGVAQMLEDLKRVEAGLATLRASQERERRTAEAKRQSEREAKTRPYKDLLGRNAIADAEAARLRHLAQLEKLREQARLTSSRRALAEQRAQDATARKSEQARLRAVHELERAQRRASVAHNQALRETGQRISKIVGGMGEWLRHTILMPAKMLLILEAFRVATFIVDFPKRMVRGLREAYEEFAKFNARMMGLELFAGSKQVAEERRKKLEALATMPGIDLEQAIKGSMALQAVEVPFDDTVGILYAVSNAAHQAGRDIGDLDRILYNLSQMWVQSKVSGIDFKEFIKAIPQAANVAKAAFGTLKTDEIARMGYSGAQVVRILIAGLLQLPKVTDSAENALDNLREAYRLLLIDLGWAIDPFIRPLIEFTTAMIRAIRASGILSTVFKNMFSMIDVQTWQQAVIKAVSAVLATITQLPQVFKTAWAIIEPWLERWKSILKTIAILMILPFTTQVATAIINITSLVAKFVIELRKGAGLATAMSTAIAAISGNWKAVATGLAGFLGGLGLAYGATSLAEWAANRSLNNALSGATTPGGLDIKKWRADMASIERQITSKMPKDATVNPAIAMLNAASKNIVDQAQTDIGNPLNAIGKATTQTARNTREIADKLDWTIRGYGVSGVEGLLPTSREVARWSSGGAVNVVVQGAKSFEQMLADLVSQTVAQMQKQGAFAR